MNTMDFIVILLYLICAIVSIIMIVKYFQLCKDVASMREALNPLVVFRERFALLISLGDKEEARRLLISHIQKHSVFGEAFGTTGESYTDSSRKEIRATYGAYLEALDMDFDFEKVDAFIKSGRRK